MNGKPRATCEWWFPFYGQSALDFTKSLTRKSVVESNTTLPMIDLELSILARPACRDVGLRRAPPNYQTAMTS
ncbi:MAG TPA: hypothetical protein DCE44_24350 [Verrucomicrobiales bacterium]|nr:hypothetical protein [Verrucomicrobiales bacterium]